MKFRPGVSVKTIANPLDDESLDALEKSSFATLETNMLNFETPDFNRGLFDKFLAMKKRAGISTPTFHAPYGTIWDLSSSDEATRLRAVELLIGLFKYAAELETKLIVEHPSWEPVGDDEREFRIAQLRKSLAELEEPLRQAGFRMALELLPRSCLGNTAEELLRILDGFGDTFGVCLDVNHLMSRIAELPDAVRLFGKRLYSLHISDYYGDDECHFMPGTCSIDWPPFINALVEVGYSGVFNYEMRLKGTSAERVAATLENFEKFFTPMMPA